MEGGIHTIFKHIFVIVSEHRVDFVCVYARSGLDHHKVTVVVLHVERPRDARVAVELVDYVTVQIVYVHEW